MVDWLVLTLLIAGAYFSMSVLLPVHAGRAWLLWPVAADTRPIAGIFACEGRSLTVILWVLSGTCLVAAAASWLGWFVPAPLWSSLVVVGSTASIILFLIYLNRYALLPLLLNALLLWGVAAQQWSAGF